MNAPLMTRMTEATRLTREGRLEEAMSVLRGASPGLAPSQARADAAPVLDMVPPSATTGSAWTPPKARGTPSADRPKGVLHTFLDRVGSSRTAAARAPASMPGGAQFGERTYANPAGSRVYKLYIPSGYDGTPMPLVVMLHGCTQSPDDFAAGTRMNELAEAQRFLVAYPAQAQSANASRCWNWYSAGDQHRDRGEPSLIAGITRQIMGEFPVDPGRVYVAGLSAGGAAAAIMGSTYPDLYAAIGVHSGLACGAARDIPSAFAAMRQGGPASPGRHGAAGSTPPAIVFHGDRDTTVSPVNGDQVIAQSKAAADLQVTVTRGEAAGGIGYTRTVHADRSGQPMLEHWLLHGAGHAWSGGSAAGSYTEPRGPDASREMLRFFLQHSTLR